jgi:hypothetical protein
MGDQDADRSTTKLGWQLFEHQVDWDYFDEQSLSSVAAIEDGGFKNLSGQVYRAIVVPSSTVITRAALERFQAFVKAGGRLIFAGKTPTLLVERTFLHAGPVPDLSFATLIEPSGDITPRVLGALPRPDVQLDSAFARLTYTHRSWRDAEMYLFFNESDRAESRVATIAGPIAGQHQAQSWDLATGEIHPMSAAVSSAGAVRFPLVLGPYEAKVVVVGPLPAGVAAPEPSFASGTILAELPGDSTGAAYRRQFTSSEAPPGKRAFLEISGVHDYVRVTLNGAALAARAWEPYRWDVTNVLKSGVNDLEIERNPSTSPLPGPIRLVAR